jgi:ABC-type transport system involved in cytochrome bd biosynthesis fused ATPase/permease subunit
LFGWQNQRLALARCFLQKKPVIAFDEIETAMDIQSQETLVELLPVLAQEAFVLIATLCGIYDSIAKELKDLDN